MAQEMPSDVEYERTKGVLQRFNEYCERTAAISKINPPPGLNAANALFFKQWLDDQKRLELQSNSTTGRQGGPQIYPGIIGGTESFKIAEPFVHFMIVAERAFQEQCFETSWTRNIDLLVPVAEANIANIERALRNVIGLLSGNDLESAAADLARQIQESRRYVSEKKVVGSGCHANGNIAWRIQNGATEALEKLNAAVPPGAQTYVQPIANVMRETFTAIAGLDSSNHDPWLRGEWQLGFETIMVSAHVTAGRMIQKDWAN